MIQRVEGAIVAARYQLVRELGVGGMGKVWLAHDLHLDSPCALKLIDDDKAKSEEVRVRFEREAKVSAQLRGAHVVDVFEHGEFEGTPFIAMEYLEGEDLSTRLERLGRLPAADTYRVIAHVARALARAHAYGIVHRDLKPENVFLVAGDDGEIAKVLDFGIAKHDQYSLTDKATKTGSLLGTPYYMSPEQARGKGIDHRSDLWSLGVIAFQCLTGRPPFESEALGELMGLILYEELPRPTTRNPSLPPAIDAWWDRAAARDREERFSSAKELADALGVALGVPQTVMVPSTVPARTSLLDIERLITPLPGMRRKLASGSDTERSTDAPLSHTHHSPGEDVDFADDAFADRPGRRLYRRLQSARRRALVTVAVVAGLVAGVGLTVLVSGGDDESARIPAAPPASPAPSPTPVDLAPVVTPVQTPLPSVTTPAPPLPSASSSATSSDKASRSSPSKRSTPKAPAKNTRRDYGI